MQSCNKINDIKKFKKISLPIFIINPSFILTIKCIHDAFTSFTWITMRIQFDGYDYEVRWRIPVLVDVLLLFPPIYIIHSRSASYRENCTGMVYMNENSHSCVAPVHAHNIPSLLCSHALQQRRLQLRNEHETKNDFRLCACEELHKCTINALHWTRRCNTSLMLPYSSFIWVKDTHTKRIDRTRDRHCWSFPEWRRAPGWRVIPAFCRSTTKEPRKMHWQYEEEEEYRKTTGINVRESRCMTIAAKDSMELTYYTTCHRKNSFTAVVT